MFVFVYSSYHLKLSFPHLVILTTLQTPKTCLVVLGIRRTGYPWHYLKYAVPGYAWHYLKYSELFWIPKTILLKSSRNPHPPPPQKKKKDSWNRKFQTPKNPSIIPITWNPEYTLGVVLCLNSHPIHVFIATLHLYCSHNFIISAVENLSWDFYASYDENLNFLAFFKFSLPCCCCSVHNSHQQNKRTQKYIRVLENRLDKVTFRYISSG